MAGLVLLAGCGSTSSTLVITPKTAVAGATGKTIIVGGVGSLAKGGDAAQVTAGAEAYFRFVNAHGGVFGRRIVYQLLDDHGDSALVPSLAHRLVQQDAVFAMFGLAGSAGSRSVASYLNSAGVPDVFASSGCGCLGVPALPYVFGWGLGDVQEGKLLGAFVASHFAGMRVGVVYENDQFGRNELTGLRASGVRVAARKPCVLSGQSIKSAVVALKSSGFKVVVALVSGGAKTALTQAMSALAFRPHLVVTAGSGIRADGVITDAFVPSLDEAAGTAAGSWIALFRKVHSQFMPREPFSPAVIYGMSAAYEFAAALSRSGPNPSRGGLIAALTDLPQGPIVAPLAYGMSDHLGITGGYVGVLRDGVISPLTGVLTADDSPAGTTAPGAIVQAGAPASGLPPR